MTILDAAIIGLNMAKKKLLLIALFDQLGRLISTPKQQS